MLTEPAYQGALRHGCGTAHRRQLILPATRLLLKPLPPVKLPITLYPDWRELIDPCRPTRAVESRLVVDGYLHDPAFDRWYPLAAIMLLLTTPAPHPLTELRTPTMFLLATRGIIPSYIEGLYHWLPPIEKKLIKVDGVSTGCYRTPGGRPNHRRVVCRHAIVWRQTGKPLHSRSLIERSGSGGGRGGPAALRQSSHEEDGR